MPEAKQRGVLIAIEGIDGAGKTTQVKLLSAHLNALGHKVIASKEPTNGRWGAVLRSSASAGRLSLDKELSLFVKDRAEHVETLISPAMRAGGIVILDRYFYSTIAYQGARGADVSAVTEEMLRLFPKPDLTVIIDIDPAVGIHRISHHRGEEPNSFEDHANLTRARAIFAEIPGSEIARLDGSQTVEALHAEICRRLPDFY